MSETDRGEGPVPSQAMDWPSLQEVLERPQVTSAAWQDHAARLVSLAHVVTLGSAADDLEYLRALALVKWAQTAGVREAKKKTVTPLRFRSKEPPDLDLLVHPLLRQYGLDVLSSVKTGWCVGYIDRVLRSEDLGKRTVSVLGKWALKNTNSACLLIGTVLGVPGEPRGSAEQMQLLINELRGLVRKISWDTTETAARDVGESFALIGTLLKSAGDGKEVRAALWKLLSSLEEHARLLYPLLIVERNFVMGVAALRGHLAGEGQAKPLDALSLRLARASVSCCAYFLENGGGSEIARLKALVPDLKQAYPDFIARVGEAKARKPALGELLDSTESTGEVSLENQAASIYARLLPGWHEFMQGHSDNAAVESLNATLLEAAGANGVEFMGKSGDVSEFDPIVHRLLDDEGSVRPRLVKLVRPAIVHRRTGASYRVVVQALVSVAVEP